MKPITYTRGQALPALLEQRIAILDGAMGTMIQRFKLTEADYRGERFKDHPRDLKNNGELLSLTRPDVIRDIHEGYLAAGADIIETNTFGATRIAQDDYDLGDLAREMNLASARLARAAADKFSTPDKPRFVAGALGPTPKTASISPDVNDPGARNVDFEQLRAAYYEQVAGAGRRRRRPAAGRDHLRHAQRQGRAVRDRRVFRGHPASACRSSSAARSPTRRAASCRARPSRPSGTACATRGRWPWA